MRIFIFEFITGGGWFSIDPTHPPSGSLLAEGRAMLEAVATDFAAIDGVEVSTLSDERLSDDLCRFHRTVTIGNRQNLQPAFLQTAADADFSLLIAPEFNGYLLEASEDVANVGVKLLSPSPDFIRLTSDKHATAEYLRSRSVSVPQGIRLEAGQSIPVGSNPTNSASSILKPCDGAGSTDVRLLDNAAMAHEFLPVQVPARLEAYHPGVAASVAVLCGRNGSHVLSPCRQILSDDLRFQYQGGACPIDQPLALRAQQLAKQAINALPATVGYVGIDMVLGEDTSGREDVVIEVNPRLTTSYVGLRALIQENLAVAMLNGIQGEPVELSARPGRVEFSAGGQVHFYDE